MQNSELYRQSVVLPLDPDAEQCLRTNEVGPSTHVRVVEIPDDRVFTELWRIRLFDEINVRCAVAIDEHEEEWVAVSAITAVLAVIDSVADTAREPATAEFLCELKALAVEARAMSRPLLFVL